MFIVVDKKYFDNKKENNTAGHVKDYFYFWDEVHGIRLSWDNDSDYRLLKKYVKLNNTKIKWVSEFVIGNKRFIETKTELDKIQKLLSSI